MSKARSEKQDMTFYMGLPSALMLFPGLKRLKGILAAQTRTTWTSQPTSPYLPW